MLVQRYQIIKELSCEPKEEVIMNNFLENVNINDLSDNPSQPKKRKFSKKIKNSKGNKDIRALFLTLS